MKARAVCALSADTVAIREVVIPEPGPAEVLVSTACSSISTGTERWVITGQFHPPGRPPNPYPLVPGYQKVGRVEAFGHEVHGLSVGQWVFATTSLISSGAASVWGGHIEYSVCHETEVIPLPDGLDPVKASALVLTQVGYNGGARPPVNRGDDALVVGDGLVGQWLAQTLRHRGARVTLVGRRTERLELARRYSADRVVNERDSSLDAVRAEMAPNGFAIGADTVGTAQSVERVISVARRDGHVILNGYYREGEHLLSMQAIHSREATIHAPAGWTRDRLLATLDLVQKGVLKVEELMTHRIPAAEASRAYDLVLRKTEPFLGICLQWR